ncbi:MAG: Mbeg1-like protein [Pseudomonadota bacterium]
MTRNLHTTMTPGLRRSAHRLLLEGCEVLQRTLATLAVGVLASGASVASICFSDADCQGNEFCNITEPDALPPFGTCEGPNPPPPPPDSFCAAEPPATQPEETERFMCDDELGNVPHRIPYRTLHGYDPAGSATGVGVIFIGDDGVFDRPVVIPDGFDRGSTRTWQCMYGLLSQSNLLNEVLANGYDVVLVDFDQGEGDVRGHAGVLTSILQQLEDHTTGLAPIALVGPSMGGIVARYALLSMEQDNTAHRIATLISYDSPHLGANISPAIQYTTHWLQRVSAQASDRWRSIDSPGARQLLRHHITGSALFPYESLPVEGDGLWDNDLETSYDVDLKPASEHIHLLNELAQMGDYPRVARMVAFSNGSNRGARVVKLNGYDLEPADGMVFGTGSGGSSDQRLDLRAEPASGRREVFYGDVRATLGGNDRSVSYRATGEALDGAPGSVSDFANELAEVLRDDDKIDAVDQRVRYTNFIPTKSALAYTGDFYDDIANELLSGRKSTPFDATYSPATNETHLCITRDERNQLIDELRFVDSYRAALLSVIL